MLPPFYAAQDGLGSNRAATGISQAGVGGMCVGIVGNNAIPGDVDAGIPGDVSAGAAINSDSFASAPAARTGTVGVPAFARAPVAMEAITVFLFLLFLFILTATPLTFQLQQECI